MPSHENAIMFEPMINAPNQISIAEKNRIKTIEIKDEKDLKIIKMMKVSSELKQIQQF